MPETYKPNEAAQLIGVSVHSIRRWCNDHSAALSDSASPQPGAPRQLDARDIEVLRTVRDLRAQGMTTPAINERLATMTFATADSTELATAAHTAPGGEIMPTVVLDALASLTAPFVARLEAIERRQAAGEEARRHWLVAFALGAICMGLLIVLIALLIVYAK